MARGERRVISFNLPCRDLGSISNLRGTTLRGDFFVKKKGAVSENEKGIASLEGHVPLVPPVPISMLPWQFHDILISFKMAAFSSFLKELMENF